MDPEQRDALRERARLRPITCPSCGSTDTHEADGAACGGMPGIPYRVCSACGQAQARTPRRRRPRRLL